MKSRILLSILILAAFMAVTVSSQTDDLSGSGKGEAPVITVVPRTISYQGYLTDLDGNPINGILSVEFLIYDTPNGGTALWNETQTVDLVDGNFTTELGSVTPIDLAFDTQYFLELVVESETLNPRQHLNMVPYSARTDTSDFALAIADNAVSSSSIQDGSIQFLDIGQNGASTNQVMKWNGSAWVGSWDENTTYQPGDGIQLAGTTISIESNGITSGMIENGTIATSDIGQNGASSGQVLKWNGTAWVVAEDETGGGGGGWADDGNAVRLETDTDSVGIGTSTPTEKLDVIGNLKVDGKATIGADNSNTGDHAFVAGYQDTVGGYYSAVLGGYNNSANGNISFVGGGTGNKAYGSLSFIGGGNDNTTTGSYGAIAGGDSNSVGTRAFVGGGYANNASHSSSAIAGGDSNYTAAPRSFIGGGAHNTVNGDYSAILGGYNNYIYASADYSLLFGINSYMDEDSTFMVNMPHIHFGGVSNGYEFPVLDGTSGQVLATDGSGQLGWTTVSGGGGIGGSGTANYLSKFTDPNNIGNSQIYDDGTNVGIGTSSPAFKLDVFGDMHTAGNFTSDGYLMTGGDANISGNVNATQNVLAGGYVSAAGDVISGGNLLGLGVNVGSFQMNPGASSGYVLTSDGSGGGTWQALPPSTGTGWADDGTAIRLETATDSVGIGTSNPSSKLDVAGDFHASGNITTDGVLTTGGDANVNGNVSTTQDFVAGGNISLGGSLSATGDIEAENNGTFIGDVLVGGGLITGVNIAAGGSITAIVDIEAGNNGTFGNNVSVAGNLTATGANLESFQMPTGASSGYVLTSDGSGNGTWQAAPGGGGGDGWVDDGTVVRLDSYTDSVGIGLNVPSEKLDVNGNIRVRGKANLGAGTVNSGTSAFVAGSQDTASGDYSVASGGAYNAASGSVSTVSGGYGNKASHNFAAIAGGKQNTASGYISFVGGGENNSASIDYAANVGGLNNTLMGAYSFIGGGSENSTAYNYTHGFIGGGRENAVAGNYAVVSGGYKNDNEGAFSVISGGYADTINSAATYSYLFGIGSSLTQDSTFMVDMPHIRFGDESTGYEIPNTDGSSGQVLATDGSGQVSWTTVSGGGGWTDDGNVVRLDTDTDSVGIGTSNPQEKLTVMGGILAWNGKGNFGLSNNNLGDYSLVTGLHNSVDGDYSAVVGGSWNIASGSYGFVGGGSYNEASGFKSATLGGQYNCARQYYSVAIGSNGVSNHDYSIVLAASTDGDSVFTGNDGQILLRADGGIYITDSAGVAPSTTTNIIRTRGGAYLSGDGNTWTNSSDRNKKENFEPVNKAELLEKISSLPINKWNYKTDDESIKHIGPVAQDFNSIFGVGADSTSISTIDPSGVALAGIQALLERIDQLEARVAELEAERKSNESH